MPSGILRLRSHLQEQAEPSGHVDDAGEDGESSVDWNADFEFQRQRAYAEDPGEEDDGRDDAEWSPGSRPNRSLEGSVDFECQDQSAAASTGNSSNPDDALVSVPPALYRAILGQQTNPCMLSDQNREDKALQAEGKQRQNKKNKTKGVLDNPLPQYEPLPHSILPGGSPVFAMPWSRFRDVLTM